MLEATLTDDLIGSILTFLGGNEVVSKSSLINKYFKNLIESYPEVVTSLDLLRNNIVLEKNIKDCSDGDVSVGEIAKYTSLEKLIFPQECPYGAVMKIAPCLSKLKYVDLSNSNISNEEFIALTSHLRNIKNLYLKLEWCDAANQATLMQFCTYFRGMLRGFRLYNSNITDSGLKAIASHFCNLKALSLGLCENITNEGLLAVAHRLGNNLRYFNVAGCNFSGAVLIKLLPRLHNLKYLDVKDCEFADIQELKTLLSDLPHLRELGLGGLDFVTDDLLKFITHYMPDLDSLHLPGCKSITSEGIDYLIAYHDKLRDLELDDTNLADIVSAEIYQLYKTPKGIAELRQRLRAQMSSSQSSSGSSLR